MLCFCMTLTLTQNAKLLHKGPSMFYDYVIVGPGVLDQHQGWLSGYQPDSSLQDDHL